jgi:hypothetical protein
MRPPSAPGSDSREPTGPAPCRPPGRRAQPSRWAITGARATLAVIAHHAAMVGSGTRVNTSCRSVDVIPADHVGSPCLIMVLAEETVTSDKGCRNQSARPGVGWWTRDAVGVPAGVLRLSASAFGRVCSSCATRCGVPMRRCAVWSGCRWRPCTVEGMGALRRGQRRPPPRVCMVRRRHLVWCRFGSPGLVRPVDRP